MNVYPIFVLTIGVAAYSPVILVPGAPGSQIEAKLHNKAKPAWYCDSSTKAWFTLWLSLSSLVPYKINCWIDNMRLQWDMDSMTVKSPSGMQTRVPGFGSTKTIETLDSHGLVKYMKPMVDYLKKLGYVVEKNLHGAPYDFRYSPDNLPGNFYHNLKLLVEKSFIINGKKRVTLISHSYGCIITQYFLMKQTRQWKKLYLKQWIPLAGPFGGSKQLAELYASGYLEGVPEFLVNRLAMRASQRSGTSNLWMLPSLAAWPADEIMVKTKDRQYTIGDMDIFLKDIGFPEGVQMRHHITNSSYFMTIAPGIPVHCFYGHVPNSTINQIEFGDDFPDTPSKTYFGFGDGTINQKSLQLCQRFAHLQKEQVTVKRLNGVKHQDIISNKDVLKAIQEMI